MRLARRLSTIAVLLVFLVAPGAGSSARSAGTLAPSPQLQTALLEQLNAVRTAHGLPRLRASARLARAANGHSVQMARLGYFSHNSASGASFSQRIAQYYPLRGYHSWAVGENLLWASPGVGAGRAIAMWLASPAHRANLLSPRWREVGLAAVHSTNAPGVYGGSPATIVTADFGTRR